MSKHFPKHEPPASKPKRVPMVKVLLHIPLWLREALETIKERDGVTISEQARMSLTIWVKRCARDPHGALGPLTQGMSQEATEAATAYATPEPVPLGPEPDPETDPAAWASWSARAGTAAIAKLAKGDWTP
jgi:hypothetical protein